MGRPSGEMYGTQIIMIFMICPSGIRYLHTDATDGMDVKGFF